MPARSSFSQELLILITQSLNNNHEDNFDERRYGHKAKFKQHLQTHFHRLLGKYNFVKIRQRSLVNLTEHLQQLSEVYELLSNEESKRLMVQLMAYWIMGLKKIKLPLNTPSYFSRLAELDENGDKSDFVNPKFLHFKLFKHKLDSFGFPIQVYLNSKGIMADFILRQYEYKKDNIHVKADVGDVVIDAGGCWGNTALYFANQVQDTGAVYSFEFIPSNLSIFERNLQLNENLRTRIKVIDNPVWSESGQSMYYVDKGPGSSVSFSPQNVDSPILKTKSIDDLVQEEQLNRVDFIKMDIEGAEPQALLGAINSIKKWRPKLAIAIYHSLDDFVNIPLWVQSLNLEYEMYIGHYTIHNEETILFCQPK